MPIHDWARVDPNLFHHFHRNWTAAICDALNSGLLQAHLSALLERRTVDGPQTESDLRGDRVVVRRRLSEIVCVIEVVSPGNKHSRLAFEEFVRKAVGFLRNGVHVSIVDLLPPTARDPKGVPAAILGEFGESFELVADKPLTVAAYAAGDLCAGLATTAYVEPMAVGDPLPDMPA
jgi:hypothetical protein